MSMPTVSKSNKATCHQLSACNSYKLSYLLLRMQDATNFDGKHDGKFFEEFIELLPSGDVKCHGVRVVDSPQGRKLGIDGRVDMSLIAPVKLLRCFKEVQIRASLKRPVRIFTTLQKLGR